ncbi:MAG: hypothetical protein QNJ16_08630 [Rhodobacter sp.]|nr:hypothetical protein [Rhodobacter sp.]
MSTQMIFDEATVRYLDGKAKAMMNGRRPQVFGNGPTGRAYCAPDIPEFRIFADLKRRVQFWKR